MPNWFDDNPLWCDDTLTAMRPCAHEGCLGDGLYPAPKSKQALNDRQWLCLDHIRSFNARWNFADGLTADEIERLIRQDVTWQRPTRPIGEWRKREDLLRRRAERMRAGRASAEAAAAAKRAPTPALQGALKILDLTWPIDDKTLQSRYRTLVKEHHPDVNGSSAEAEEKIKEINIAYNLLRSFLAHGITMP
jgi:hypothetical protein